MLLAMVIIFIPKVIVTIMLLLLLQYSNHTHESFFPLFVASGSVPMPVTRDFKPDRTAVPFFFRSWSGQALKGLVRV